MTLTLDKPCTIIRRIDLGGSDAYGNEVPGEELEATVCYFEQRARDEDDLAGELGVETYMALLPVGTDLSTASALVVDGHKYELVGPPARREAPQAWLSPLHHVEATVKRTAGAAETGS